MNTKTWGEYFHHIHFSQKVIISGCMCMHVYKLFYIINRLLQFFLFYIVPWHTSVLRTAVAEHCYRGQFLMLLLQERIILI